MSSYVKHCKMLRGDDDDVNDYKEQSHQTSELISTQITQFKPESEFFLLNQNLGKLMQVIP